MSGVYSDTEAKQERLRLGDGRLGLEGTRVKVPTALH